MSFKDKLSKIISESSSNVVFNDQEYITAMQTEDSILAEIVAAIPLHGVTFHQYEEGVLSVSTRKKSAVLSFTAYLDDNSYVDSYDISAQVYNPINGTVNQDSVDFDLVIDNELIEYYIDVVLVPDYVEYSPVYVEVDDDSVEPYTFDYQDGDDVYSQVKSTEVPILLNVIDIPSHSEFGSFTATLHPKDESKFLVQAVYTDVPNEDDAQADVDLINTFMGDYELADLFTVISSASYKNGELKTTSAIYQSIDKKKDVMNIVEAFGSVSEIKYDQLLHEVRRVVKVNFRGKRRIKMQCHRGYKYDETRKVCVKISGKELALSRIAHRQMARTKKAKGEGYKRKIVRKTNRAKRFRKLIGY